MACALTQDLNLDCRDSRGGVFTAYCIEFENVDSITLTSNVVSAIDKATTKVFRKYNLVAYTGEATEELTNSRENGTSFAKQMIKFPINKMTAAIRDEILLLAKNRLIWILTDNNGNSWLYGRVFGLMMTTGNITLGKALADRNGAELTFEGDEYETAISVQTAVIATLQTPGA